MREAREVVARALLDQHRASNDIKPVSDEDWQGCLTRPWLEYFDNADLILTALETAGLRVLPREPSDAMMNAGGNCLIPERGGQPAHAGQAWCAMWDAVKPAASTPDGRG